MNSEVTPTNSLLAGKDASQPPSPKDPSNINASTSPEEEARSTPNNNLRTTTNRTISVKDFAYDASHPLHYGVLDQDQDSESDYDDYDYDDYDYDYDDGLILDKDENPVPDDNDDPLDNNNKDEQLVHAIALYPFQPENENELELVEDQLIIINYEYGDGWLVAHDPYTEETGLIPSEYIHILTEEELEEAAAAATEEVEFEDQAIVETTVVSSNGDHSAEISDTENEDGFIDDSISTAKPFLPSILQDTNPTAVTNNVDEDDDQWEDYDGDSNNEDVNENKRNSDGVPLTQKLKNMQL